MILRYTDRSKANVDLTFEWYEKQRRGLGFEFLDCVEVSLKNILIFPEMYEQIYSGFRKGDEIVIHSVFDNRQDPKKRPRE